MSTFTLFGTNSPILDPGRARSAMLVMPIRTAISGNPHPCSGLNELPSGTVLCLQAVIPHSLCDAAGI